MHVSRFTPDPSRQAEFLACLWQGDVPSSLRLSKWLYLAGEPRRMLLLWEGDDEAAAYVERAFGGFGVLDTEAVTDSTPGLAAAFRAGPRRLRCVDERGGRDGGHRRAVSRSGGWARTLRPWPRPPRDACAWSSRDST